MLSSNWKNKSSWNRLSGRFLEKFCLNINFVPRFLANESTKRCNCFCTSSSWLSHLYLEIIASFLEFGVLLHPLDVNRMSASRQEKRPHVIKKQNERMIKVRNKRGVTAVKKERGRRSGAALFQGEGRKKIIPGGAAGAHITLNNSCLSHPPHTCCNSSPLDELWPHCSSLNLLEAAQSCCFDVNVQYYLHLLVNGPISSLEKDVTAESSRLQPSPT